MSGGWWSGGWFDRHPYATSSTMVAIVSAFGFAAGPLVQAANLDILYLLAVFVAALRWGRRPALYCGVAAAVTFNFCFVPPRYSFHASDWPYAITLIGFVIVALVTSEVASRARDALIAERARATAETARAQAEAARIELEATNRATEALLRQIAHELRSPLNAILGRVHMLQTRADDPAKLVPLRKIEHSARILARLVGELLDASSMHVGRLPIHPQPVRLTSPVARAVDDLALRAADKGIELVQNLAPVPHVLADPDRIEQIVANLVTNAIKFTPRGGRVTVVLRDSPTDIELVVSDTGTGIPREFLPHVFDAFAQAPTAVVREGLGLGLAIVKHLVEAHGGRVVVQSPAPDAATMFIARFPHVPPDSLLSGPHAFEASSIVQ